MKKINKTEWTYTGAYSYAGDYFSIWVKPNTNKNGKLYMKTKAIKSTLEQINEDAKEYGATYVGAFKVSEDE